MENSGSPFKGIQVKYITQFNKLLKPHQIAPTATRILFTMITHDDFHRFYNTNDGTFSGDKIRHKLIQVLHNLLDNAIKLSNPGSNISIVIKEVSMH